MQTIKEVETANDMVCPIRYMLDLFGGKWKLPIVCMLSAGTPIRYSAIKRKLGSVTNMMLSQSLKELEAAGVINRQQYNEVPPRVEYSLAEKGKSILPALTQMAQWAVTVMQKETACGINCETCISTS